MDPKRIKIAIKSAAGIKQHMQEYPSVKDGQLLDKSWFGEVDVTFVDDEDAYKEAFRKYKSNMSKLYWILMSEWLIYNPTDRLKFWFPTILLWLNTKVSPRIRCIEHQNNWQTMAYISTRFASHDGLMERVDLFDDLVHTPLDKLDHKLLVLQLRNDINISK